MNLQSNTGFNRCWIKLMKKSNDNSSSVNVSSLLPLSLPWIFTHSIDHININIFKVDFFAS